MLYITKYSRFSIDFFSNFLVKLITTFQVLDFLHFKFLTVMIHLLIVLDCWMKVILNNWWYFDETIAMGLNYRIVFYLKKLASIDKIMASMIIWSLPNNLIRIKSNFKDIFKTFCYNLLFNIFNIHLIANCISAFHELSRLDDFEQGESKKRSNNFQINSKPNHNFTFIQHR